METKQSQEQGVSDIEDAICGEVGMTVSLSYLSIILATSQA